MAQIECESKPVKSVRLQAFCSGLLVAAGLSGEDAEIVADSLVESNLRGIDSHGVARLPHYLNRIAHGSIRPRPEMRFERLGAAVGRLDGGQGPGQLVMHRATHEAMTLAEEAGAGWVGVSNSSHCGALAYYGLEMARAGMIGFVFTHVDPMVLPYGSRKPFCGTNPICLAVPANDGRMLCLDMATSVVPWNTVANAAMEGVPIPQGWAVDKNGQDTTDAKQVSALHPFGGYKGSGLGLMIDVLCSMLVSAPFGPNIPKMYGDPAQPRQLGGLVGAIRIENFGPLAAFHEKVGSLMERWAALPPSEPGGKVLYPGEPEMLCREKRLRDGIPLGLELLKQFSELSSRYKLNQELTYEA
jgi:ureidoglycolate dehydrogenase (NAD+)